MGEITPKKNGQPASTGGQMGMREFAQRGVLGVLASPFTMSFQNAAAS